MIKTLGGYRPPLPTCLLPQVEPHSLSTPTEFRLGMVLLVLKRWEL